MTESADQPDGYLGSLEEWDQRHPPFDVGMSVLVYESAYKGNLEGMGRVIQSQWRSGIEYGWIYMVEHPAGDKAWYNPGRLERLALDGAERRAYFKVC